MPTLVEHKTARRDYEIIERFEAGIELVGGEVKSLRSGHGKLTGAHVVMHPSTKLGAGGEAYVVGMHVSSYQPRNTASTFDPERTRRLLLTRNELATLGGVVSKKGQTIIPLSVYTKGKKIKIEIALVKGKKKYDKREDIKKREDERAMGRIVKERVNE